MLLLTILNMLLWTCTLFLFSFSRSGPLYHFSNFLFFYNFLFSFWAHLWTPFLFSWTLSRLISFRRTISSSGALFGWAPFGRTPFGRAPSSRTSLRDTPFTSWTLFLIHLRGLFKTSFLASFWTSFTFWAKLWTLTSLSTTLRRGFLTSFLSRLLPAIFWSVSTLCHCRGFDFIGF